jgi:hypothetical protein
MTFCEMCGGKNGEIFLNELVVACLKVLFCHVCGRAKENNQNTYSGYNYKCCSNIHDVTKI